MPSIAKNSEGIEDKIAQAPTGGTENVIGIVGFGKAAELRMCYFKDCISIMKECRNRLESIIQYTEPEVTINGSQKKRVCNTTNLRFPGVDGRMLVAKLDKEGVFCSQSSACTSNHPEPSRVLQSMGLSEDEAYSSIRFSFGPQNTIKEAEIAAEIVIQAYRRAKELSRLFL